MILDRMMVMNQQMLPGRGMRVGYISSRRCMVTDTLASGAGFSAILFHADGHLLVDLAIIDD